MGEEAAKIFNSLSEEEKKEALDFMNFLRTKPKTQEAKKPKRPLGVWKGRIKMMPNFDEPLEDFAEEKDFSRLKNYWGKIDLDIDLDAARDRKQNGFG